MYTPTFRRRLLVLAGAATAFIGVIATPPARAAEPVKPQDFARLHALIKPAPAEQAWSAEIPWMASLWDARVRAAAEGKPILLWEMDGHPLGCV